MGSLVAEKTAVVTGASSGIGQEIAATFAEHDADVVVADLQVDPRGGGVPTHEHIRAETGADAVYVECDVTERADLEAAVAAADQFGGIDVMVNNAGVAAFGGLLEATEADFEKSMAVNQKGVFFGCQAAIPPMVEQGEGRIINMSSVAGLRGWAGSALYCMSKAAVKLLSYTVAAEFGPDGIRANALHPGTIRTEMTLTDLDLDLDLDEGESERRAEIALREIGRPRDVANAALFLASDLGSYVNGVSIPVDGGMVNLQS
jgi:NAD(P)-dependent dehydrogenase (short-subunit alcohol dehydrogenase family)